MLRLLEAGCCSAFVPLQKKQKSLGDACLSCRFNDIDVCSNLGRFLATALWRPFDNLAKLSPTVARSFMFSSIALIENTQVCKGGKEKRKGYSSRFWRLVRLERSDTAHGRATTWSDHAGTCR